MINDYHMLSGLQKVAILFSVVGESLALSLVKGLSKTNIRKIRSTVREMDAVSYSVKERVMEEFYFGFLSEQFETVDKEDGPIQPFEFLKDLNEDYKIFSVIGNDGTNVHRGFCPNCGSPIISFVTEQPNLRFIKAGSLDNSDWLKIESSFWSVSACKWDPINESLPSYPKNPN